MSQFFVKCLKNIWPSLLLLVVIELACRMFVWNRFHGYQTNFHIQANSRWQDDQNLVWRNRPYYLEYDRSCQYNSIGMRCAAGEVDMPHKQLQEFRVFLLGGSAMAGVGSSRKGDWLKLTGVSGHGISQSIDGHLEAILQKAMPERTVKVFNSAVSGYTLPQSHLLAEQLMRWKPDFVISMDGVNEPVRLKEDESVLGKIRNRWRGHAVNNFPLNLARVLMRNSAFAYVVGEYTFFRTNMIMSHTDMAQDQETIDYWLKKNVDRRSSPSPNSDQKTAINAFVSQLKDYHYLLNENGIPHLLLIQPYLAESSADMMVDRERAVYHYFLSQENPELTTFISGVQASVKSDLNHLRCIKNAKSYLDQGEWNFLDHCHLTSQANSDIARGMAEYILGNVNDQKAPE